MALTPIASRTNLAHMSLHSLIQAADDQASKWLTWELGGLQQMELEAFRWLHDNGYQLREAPPTGSRIIRIPIFKPSLSAAVADYPPPPITATADTATAEMETWQQDIAFETVYGASGRHGFPVRIHGGKLSLGTCKRILRVHGYTNQRLKRMPFSVLRYHAWMLQPVVAKHTLRAHVAVSVEHKLVFYMRTESDAMQPWATFARQAILKHSFNQYNDFKTEAARNDPRQHLL